MKLSRKVTIFFISAILLSIFIVSLISNSIINRRFDTFLLNEKTEKLDQVSNEINDLYEENEYSLYEGQLSSYASLEDLTIKIKTLDDTTIYSSENMHGMGHMHKRMMRGRGMDEGEYVEKEFPLSRNEEVVGTIVLGYIDNSYLTESALIFKNTLTRILFVSAIVALIIGVLTSIFLSNNLTKPLLEIRDTAVEMQKGNLKNRSQVNTSTIEIRELSTSINYLGETLSLQDDIRKKYASNISHELRTPISTLKSHIEAIMDGVWEASPEHLSILMNEINRLANLVDDLKNSFNLDEDSISLNKTTFNLSDDINNIITSFTPRLSKNKISIEKNIEEDINAHLDRDKVKQVVYNVLENSIKYLDENGKISITLKSSSKDKVTIRVIDNGIGISEDDLPFIFDRFYRVDESRSKSTGGSGLGLSIAKSIVKAHGGEIGVNSVYGEGTEFIIDLPLMIY